MATSLNVSPSATYEGLAVDSTGLHHQRLHVRHAVPEDWEECMRLVLQLPEFFTEDVPERVRSDLRLHYAWVLVDDDGVAGFLVASRRFPRTAEILWMAIDRARRRLGLGTQLLKATLRDLRLEGVDVVEVKTLDSSADYPPYAETRAFWECQGFVHIDTIDPLPGWGEDNPAAFYVAALIATVEAGADGDQKGAGEADDSR